jgi:hypothetical protein
MKIFRFMLKKDLRFVLIVTAVLVIFSGTMQVLQYRDTYEYEPYYSQTFNELSENADFYNIVDEEYQTANSDYEDAYAEIFEFMYGENYNPNKPPVEIPSEMIEKLFVPSSDSGKYTPLAETDAQMLSQMSLQISSQKNYRQEIADQLENYDRNVRRGVKDEYTLAVSEKLTEEYTAVLETPFEKPVDTRGANTLVDYFSADFIVYFAAFVLLFHRFSSEIQSRRFLQFSVSKYGARKFTVTKMLSGYVDFVLFYIIYCLSLFGIFFVFNKDTNVLFAPVQVLSEYDLSPETLTVLQYIFLLIFTKFVYCLALCGVIMLISFVCKRTIWAGAVGVIFTAVPIISGKLYTSYDTDLSRDKLKIIFSCDCYNMYHGLNFLNIGGIPIKIYLLYFVILAAIAVISSGLLVLVSRKRGAANV